jgi:hypothetical protein
MQSVNVKTLKKELPAGIESVGHLIIGTSR